MTAQSHQPFQFNLKELFALTAFVGVLLGLLPVAYRSPRMALAIYASCGLIQLFCARAVYRRFRTAGIRRDNPNHQPYELALLGGLFTLGTWALTVVWLIERSFHVELFWSFGVVLVSAFVGMVPHVPVFLLNVIGLMKMRERGDHWPLATLFLLNLMNTLFMFAAMFELVGAHMPDA